MQIGFIGLGNMGLPMALNLVKAGHKVAGHDVTKAAVDKLAAGGGSAGTGIDALAAESEAIVTMLPAGQHVRDVYLGADGVLAKAKPGTLLIDSSTIDVETARAVAGAAAKKGMLMLDAPVSGGVAGAAGRHAHLHGGRPGRSVCQGQARARGHGQDRGACGCGRRRAGGEDLQQHDPRLLDDRGVGGLRARREARPRQAEALRHLIEVVGAVLVAHELLPGAGASAGGAGEPRLRAGLHRGDDAEGPEARPGRGERRRAPRRRSAPRPRRSTSATWGAGRAAGAITSRHRPGAGGGAPPQRGGGGGTAHGSARPGRSATNTPRTASTSLRVCRSSSAACERFSPTSFSAAA